jgi:uncharacterized protein (TIGR02246 family)
MSGLNLGAMLFRCGLLLIAGGLPAAAHAENAAQEAEEEIRAALGQWMADFNAGNSGDVCSLFAPDVVADLQGKPERGYDAVCEVLLRSLNDPTKTYTYSLAIKEILVSGDLAVVRPVWTLKVANKDGSGDITSVEHGMDVFRRQPDGSWKIARYIAYDAP